MPYAGLPEALRPGGVLHAAAAGRRVIFYCAYGERSAMTVQAAREAGLATSVHLKGGMDAWNKATPA